jgi:hypothetical protein
MRRRIVLVVLVVLMTAAVLVLRTLTKGPLAFAGGRTVALADYHEADPTGVPQNLANADEVKRGEYLARAADCLVCRTAPGGADYAGGLAIPLPFGTLYTTNITPDKDTGIDRGAVTQCADNRRQHRQAVGVAAQGRPLTPPARAARRYLPGRRFVPTAVAPRPPHAGPEMAAGAPTHRVGLPEGFPGRPWGSRTDGNVRLAGASCTGSSRLIVWLINSNCRMKPNHGALPAHPVFDASTAPAGRAAAVNAFASLIRE